MYLRRGNSVHSVHLASLYSYRNTIVKLRAVFQLKIKASALKLLAIYAVACVWIEYCLNNRLNVRDFYREPSGYGVSLLYIYLSIRVIIFRRPGI